MSVVRQQVDLDQDREAKLQALRKTINESIAEGGEGTGENLEMVLEAKMVELKKAGF